MTEPTNVLLAGVGGQGTILAGKLLARAAVLSGLDVKFSEVHGMAQRGGSVVTHVRLGERVHAPIVEPGCADFVVAFEQLEALRSVHMLRPGGLMVASTQRVDPLTVLTGAAAYPADALARLSARAHVLPLDAVTLATETGTARASNVVLVGCLARHMGLSRALWDRALAETVPARHLAANQRAFEAGWQAAPAER